MTYVVKRIDEQMYGCEEPAPGAEVLVDVTLVAPDGVKRVLPYPDAACSAKEGPPCGPSFLIKSPAAK